MPREAAPHTCVQDCVSLTEDSKCQLTCKAHVHIGGKSGQHDSNKQFKGDVHYLHDFYLCGCGKQFGQAGLQALFAYANVFAFLTKQLDEGCKQLQVTCWSDLECTWYIWGSEHNTSCITADISSLQLEQL